MNKLHIAFILDYFYPHIGGVEKLFYALASELVKEGHEVTIITWKYSRHLKNHEVIEGLRIIRINAPNRILFSLMGLKTFILNVKSADIIHTSTYSAAFGAWVAARIQKKKIVLTVHEFWGNMWRKVPFLNFLERTIFLWLEKLLFKLNFDHYIAVSNHTKENLVNAGIVPQKISRIYNGINYNLPQWKGNKEPFSFTYFGRAGVSKGLDLLLEAAEDYLKYDTSATFKFIVSPQNPNVFNYVKNKTNTGLLASHSTLLSNLNTATLQDELIHSNCIIIPSYSEGFGFTAVEAVAMGIPIISSNRGALQEVVSGNVIKFEPYSVKGLLQAMIKAKNNDFEQITLRQFTTKAFIKEHQQLYTKLISLTHNC